MNIKPQIVILFSDKQVKARASRFVLLAGEFEQPIRAHVKQYSLVWYTAISINVVRKPTRQDCKVTWVIF